MIQNGSTVIIRTKDAIYSPCKITSITPDNVTVTYYAGSKKDRKTGELYEDHPVETISRKNITSISERL